MKSSRFYSTSREITDNLYPTPLCFPLMGCASMKTYPPHRNISWFKLITPFVLTLVAEIGFSNTAAHALTFNFKPTSGTPQKVIDGFTAAGKLWSSVLADNVTVNIDIGFGSFNPSFFGEASPNQQLFSYTDVRAALLADQTSPDDAIATSNLPDGSTFNLLTNYTQDNPNGVGSPAAYLDNNDSDNNSYLRVPTANAKALGLLPSDQATSDAAIVFNNLLPWDFDRSDGVSSNTFDFVTLAAHGIGNVLGFTSGVDVLDANSPQTVAGFDIFYPEDQLAFVTPMDLFRYSKDSVAYGEGVIDWTASKTDKYFSIDGGTTKIASFSSGFFHGDGRQARNWKDNLGLGIMDPTPQLGESLQISDHDRQLFDAIGWDLVKSDPAPTPVPEPGLINGLLVVSLFGFGSRLKRKKTN